MVHKSIMMQTSLGEFIKPSPPPQKKKKKKKNITIRHSASIIAFKIVN